MLDAWIGLGANLGDRLAALRHAASALGSLGCIRARSPVYETPILGIEEPAKPFLNAALWLETSLSPQELHDRLREVEAQARRNAESVPTSDPPRPLALDLLLLGQKGDVVLVSPALTVPHPRLHLRAFALRPLLDLAPALIHPALSLPLRVLYRLLPSELSSLRLKGWL